MRLVSGHQRLHVLDTIMKGKGYKLRVSFVELSEKEEIEQLLFMNNELTQGSYEPETLRGIIASEGIDLENTGFDRASLTSILGPDLSEVVEPQQPDRVDSEKISTSLEQWRERRKQNKAKMQQANDTNYFLVCYPQTVEERQWLIASCNGESGPSMVNGTALLARLEAANGRK